VLGVMQEIPGDYPMPRLAAPRRSRSPKGPWTL
jgi:hypothetical protein